jgi:predicted O-methyltransferase YrrM
MSRMREAPRAAGLRLMRTLAGRLGFRVVARSHYSPIPELGEIPAETWTEPHPLPGIALGLDDQVRFLEEELGPFMREFRPPAHPTEDPAEFFLANGSYEAVDAEILYAIVRAVKPTRMIEIGSGYSTLVAARACATNATEGSPTELVAVEPHPRDFLLAPVEGLARLERRSATEIPIESFESLAAGDILFVDTTHVVKTGGEVNRIVLDVLPRLQPGVLVHFHDIFLPWDYPREWLERLGYFWTEQYLLQAFLCLNPDFEVVLAAHHLVRSARDRVAEQVPSLGPRTRPGAFWIRRVKRGGA